ncbi:hypothetical protein RHMOL_Rhmol02G0207700 [Rhododendron molle]|uniref:Uncharacterized protein n=1 Tax=Rhododendron molle TaxID=49168 RepID=A0ACC0PV33_RHOML|nr:hypothetical protein RHMOL_Rhmol02G0207700 [Rhododendron molle]
MYLGGTVEMIDNIEPDYCSFFDLRDLVMHYGYPNMIEMYYLLPGVVGFKNGIRKIKSDKEVMAMVDVYKDLPVMCIYATIGPDNEVVSVQEDNEVVSVQENNDVGVQVDGDVSIPLDVIGRPMNEVEDEGEDTDPDYELEEGEEDDDDDDSYNPSWLYEDLEGPDDDDIFKPRDNGKNKKIVKPTPVELKLQDWLSDHGDDDELHTMKGSDEESNKTNDPEFNEDLDMEKPVITKGMKFSNAIVFRKALREWQVQGGYDLEFVKNESSRVTVQCKEKCGFRVHASWMQQERTFQVKSLHPKHNCLRTYSNHLVNSKYIAEKYIDKLRDDPYKKVDCFKKEIRRDLVVDVSKWQLYRAKRKAREVIDGDMIEQYNTLRDYLETVMKHNPNCCLKLTVDRPGPDLPPVFSRLYCMRHIYANFRKLFKGKELKDAMWRAASAGTIWEHEAYMLKIEKMDKAAHLWLKKIPAEQWARSYFKTNTKCDILVNNLSESFNSYVLEARDKPIVSMLEWIRRKLMSRFQVKRMGMEKFTGTICPKIEKKLEGKITAAKDCFPHFSGEFKFEVDCHDTTYNVDLKDMTCGCRMWDLSGIPCKHAVAAITLNKQKPEDYIHPCYTKDTYLRVYQFMINPVPGKHDWVKTGSEPVQPPFMRKPSGRPRKLRRRGADEPPDENKVSRRFRVMSCSKCLKKGHNSRSCKNPIHPNSKLLKKKGTSSQAPNGKQSQKKAESIPAKQKQIVKANSTQDSVHTVNPGFYTQPAQVFKEPEWGFYSQQSKASSSTVNQTKAREKLPCIGGKGRGSTNVIRGRGKGSANVVRGRGRATARGWIASRPN